MELNKNEEITLTMVKLFYIYFDLFICASEGLHLTRWVHEEGNPEPAS